MQLKREQEENKQSVLSKEYLFYNSLQLFLDAHISFRVVNRVLDVFSDDLGLEKVPCSQLIINRVIQLSIGRMENFSPPVNQEFGILRRKGKIWIMDISIGLGDGKILAILEIDANHHILNAGAPTLKDIKCVAVAVSPTWNGNTIADFLKKSNE